MTDVRVGAATDVGRARKQNEDSYYAGAHIFAVADGLGGHRAGEVASRIAVEALARLDEVSSLDSATALEEAIHEANRTVHERAGKDSATAGMATTITALALDGDIAHLAHVGDSRCYLLRDGALSQVSVDHTLVARMVEEGTLTPEQADTHPQRSILTRALGSEPEVDVDTADMELARGDRILLCSDGLSSVVPEEILASVLQGEADPNRACRLLVDEANSMGGPDNITVVLLDVFYDPEATADAPPVASTRAAAPPPAPVPAPAPAHRPVARRRTRSRVRRRVVTWVVAALVLVIGGFVGMRAWADRSWFVGIDRGTVTIYRGLPTDFVIPLKRVAERTTISLEDVAPHFQDRLREGIRAATLAEARDIVDRVRVATPSPSPSATPPRSPSPSGTGT